MPPWTGLAIVLALILIGWVIRRRLVARRVRAIRELAGRLNLASQGRPAGRRYEIEETVRLIEDFVALIPPYMRTGQEARDG